MISCSDVADDITLVMVCSTIRCIEICCKIKQTIVK